MPRAAGARRAACTSMAWSRSVSVTCVAHGASTRAMACSTTKGAASVASASVASVRTSFELASPELSRAECRDQLRHARPAGVASAFFTWAALTTIVCRSSRSNVSRSSPASASPKMSSGTPPRASRGRASSGEEPARFVRFDDDEAARGRESRAGLRHRTVTSRGGRAGAPRAAPPRRRAPSRAPPSTVNAFRRGPPRASVAQSETRP